MKTKQSGVMLVEAMIAVTLLAIGLIGAIGIQARAFGALADATMRSEATMASEALVATLNNDQLNAASYAMTYNGTAPTALVPWYTETRRVIPGAKIGVTVTSPTSGPYAGTTYKRVDIVIAWQRKQGVGEFENTHRLTAHLGTGRLKDTW